MDEYEVIPPGWRGIVEDVGAGVMRAAAVCAGPCSVSFAFERVAGQLFMTWSCRPAPEPLWLHMVTISNDAHLRSAVTCEVCGRSGERDGGSTLCILHRSEAQEADGALRRRQ